MINDRPTGFDIYTERAQGKIKDFVLDKTKENNGKMTLSIDEAKEVGSVGTETQYKINGKVNITYNSLSHAFKFDNQDVTKINLDGKDIYLFSIDTDFPIKSGNKKNASTYISWVPEDDNRYGSISIGDLGEDGLAILLFGERYETPQLKDRLREEVNNNNKKTQSSISIASTKTFPDVNFKNTLGGNYSETGQYWGRNMAAVVSSRYSTNCGCGEVEIRAFGTGDDIEETTGVPFAYPDKVKAGIDHTNGQVNSVYPGESSSSVEIPNIIYDVLGVYGVPTNTIESISGSIQTSVDHTTLGPDHKYAVYYKFGGISDIAIPVKSSVPTDEVHIEYDGESKGANFVFNYSSYGGAYDKIKAYASVRYMTSDMFGETVYIWSENHWYNLMP